MVGQVCLRKLSWCVIRQGRIGVFSSRARWTEHRHGMARRSNPGGDGRRAQAWSRLAAPSSRSGRTDERIAGDHCSRLAVLDSVVTVLDMIVTTFTFSRTSDSNESC